MAKNTIAEVWLEFVSQWKNHAEQAGFPEIEKDENWPSPCEFESDGSNRWQPVLQSDSVPQSLGFANVEQALGITLNEEFKQFFTLFFSEELAAEHEKGPLYYLQAWSESDFERLQQNLIGHLMMKDKLKQASTLFFAVTDEEDLNLVVENASGAVCLEYVGKEPHQKLADSLSEFIAQTQPKFT